MTNLQETPAGTPAESDDAALMEAFLSDPAHDYRSLRYGDVVEGVIMRVDKDEILVNIGAKSEGSVPSKEMQGLTAEERAQMKPGETILVLVVQPEDREGRATLSIDKARQEKGWRTLQQMYEQSAVLHAVVQNYNKGGLLVNLDGVRGFVPISQISGISRGAEAQKQSDLARLVGREVPLKIIEINRTRNRLILSERQATQELKQERKDQILSTLKEGELREGVVSSLCDFGAFVDLGGADGLIHLSELSWSRIKHPSEVVKVGDKVNVSILSVDADRKRVTLSLKRNQPEPWTTAGDRYQLGQVVHATITQIANFGVFARLDDGIEGLIHVSELGDLTGRDIREVIKEGDVVEVRIVRIDPGRRRLGLSLRTSQEQSTEDIDA